MSVIEIVLIAVGLSMDAFAVSISNGLALKKISVRTAVTIAAAFGIFQALMPLLGYALGLGFAEVITRYDHYIALVFLGFIGGKMLFDGIKSYRRHDGAEKETGELKPASLLFQAVATSIDALIIGLSFTAMSLGTGEAVFGAAIIGTITFTLSFIGVYMGKKFGEMLGSKAVILGGIILIGIGLKVFIEHMAGG